MPTTPSTPRPHAANLTPAEVRRIAVEAGVEPRTASKYLRGERVVSTCADRIRRALDTLGYGTVRPVRGTP
jgi:DNA-binding LacI/PurR family transcriptional regulator